MSAQQHTPGEWVADVYTNHHGTTEARIYALDTGSTIAKLDGDCEQPEANANLIAAAPDLLVSLAELTDMLPGLVRQLPYGAPMSISEMHDRALAALDKATGGAS